MNNKCKFLTVLFLIFMFSCLQVQAEKNKGSYVKKSTKADAICFGPAKSTELKLNNVRAYLKTNGTMWFDVNAEYEIPKGSRKTSLFSSSLWIGGYSMPKKEGTLYMAAMRFAQRGNDYWTGPLHMMEATISPASCSFYDKFYHILRTDVERHKANSIVPDPSYEVPPSILNWPAHGRESYGESYFLAPYMDVAGDPNKYEPLLGDYPYYDFDNDLCPWTPINKQRARECPWINEQGECDPLSSIRNPKALPMPREREETKRNQGWDNMMIAADHVLKGDETIFWFLNDKGGPHSETKGNPIGLEIRVQAFAFATNDELNKMTFYSYEIINRGSVTLYDTYFSQWCDPDLGYSHDDFVGCDVIRGLGYCYNGKLIDGSGEIYAYGANPPAVGLDFFQGPYLDPDGVDNPLFNRRLADINGNQEEQEYCKRFVHYIFENFSATDDNLLDKIYINPTTLDTLRWNDQFAINGVNFGDTIVDNERFGMRAFTYHNNGQGPRTDPDLAFEYYNYLTGTWKDGTPFTYGSDGYDAGGPQCDFVFPQGSDYCNWGTKGANPGADYNNGGKTGNWSEMSPKGNNSSGGNTPDDRRFMQSAGPFTLKQGACNYITVGVPWARATTGGLEASVNLLLIADDKCQALFENCFKLLDGPDAPNLTIREYDQKLILLLSNSLLSNNANEDYIEFDNQITKERVDIIKGQPYIAYDSINEKDTILYHPDTKIIVPYDQFYRFEGYQIFQVARPDVAAGDLDDPSVARLVKQYDIVNFDENSNPIGRLINWEFNNELQLSIPVEKVAGSNTGIEHSFEITQDLFATGNRQLVNYKTYYFVAVAYAFNEFLPYSVNPDDPLALIGQQTPYLRGRKTAEGRAVTAIAAVPHPPSVHGGGATLNCDYGSIPYITRIDGQGNGGIALDLTNETIDKIMSGGDKGDWRVRELKYEKNAGPLNVKIIDPLRVKPFDYILVIKDTLLNNDKVSTSIKNKADITNEAYWILTISPTVSDQELRDAGLLDINGEPIREFISQTSIGQSYEQIIFPLGISINIHNKDFAATDPKVQKFYQKLQKKYTLSTKPDMYRIKYAYHQTEKIDMDNDVVFENNAPQWITGLVDDNKNLPSNWIRAGSNSMGAWTGDGATVRGNYDKERLEDFFFPSNSILEIKPGGGASEDRAFKDPSGKFGSVCGGKWAPYVLASPYDNGPQVKYTVPEPIFAFPPTAERQFEEPPYPNTVNPTTEFYASGLHNYYNFRALTAPYNQPGYNQTMTNLYSVNVVLTPDKSKWTRAIVLESCQDRNNSEGGALRGEPRKAKSVNKDGKPDNSTDGFGTNGDEGMGWFPGYAINVETGERLNIMFSENSDKTLNEKFGNLVRGNDMVFNPTSTYAIAKYDVFDYFAIDFPEGSVISKSMYDVMYEDASGKIGGIEELFNLGIERVWGGMHYVYVCNSSGNTSPAHYLHQPVSTIFVDSTFLNPGRRNFNIRDTVFTINHQLLTPANNITWGGFEGYLDPEKKYPFYECGPYDEGKWLVQKFKKVLSYPEVLGNHASTIVARKHTKMQLFNNVMYTSIPMQPEDPAMHSLWLSSDVTYKIRVTRPYLRYISRWYETPELRENDYSVPSEFAQYQGYPVYQLTTKGLAPTFNDTRLYQSILDKINIVPNPYYGASLYEIDALQTMVKIINLPTDLKNQAPVTINIYTVSGILVRSLTKGDSETSYVNWDLKNYANIPISSGVYIIHVNCPGIGERMLKFFCSMRQTDLNQF